MRKAVGNNDGERDLVRETSVTRQRRKGKIKKMKRKKDLEDLHQKVLKAKKKLREKTLSGKLSQSTFGKLLNEFADKRQECDRKTQGVDEKTSRLQEHGKICARLLPKPRTGMYKNGALGKGIRRDDVGLNDSTNARQRGDLFQLLNGYECNSKVLLNKEVHNESLRNRLLHLQREKGSPILGKVQGVSRKHRAVKPQEERINENCIFSDDDNKQQENHPRKSSSKHKNFFCSPYEQYVEFCDTINSEISASCTFLEDFLPDPLLSIKTKLKNIYTTTRVRFNAHDKKKHAAVSNEPRSTMNENFVDPDFCVPIEVNSYEKYGFQNRNNYGKDILGEHSYGNGAPFLDFKKHKIAQREKRNNVHKTFLLPHDLRSKTTNAMPRIFGQPSDDVDKERLLGRETNFVDFESQDDIQHATQDDFEDFLSHMRTKNKGKRVIEDSIFTSSTSSSIDNNIPRNKCTKLILSPENVLNQHFEKLNVVAPKGKSHKLVPSILRRNGQNNGQKKNDDESKYLNRAPQNYRRDKISTKKVLFSPAAIIDQQKTVNVDSASTNTQDELQFGFSRANAFHYPTPDLNQPKDNFQMYHPKQPLTIALHRLRKDPRVRKQKHKFDKTLHSQHRMFSTTDARRSIVSNSHVHNQTIPDNRIHQLGCRNCHASFNYINDQEFESENSAERLLRQNVAQDRLVDCVTHVDHNIQNVPRMNSYHGFQYNDHLPREHSASLPFERDHPAGCPANWRIPRAQAQDRVNCTNMDPCRNSVDPNQGLHFVDKLATTANIKSRRIRPRCSCEETDTFVFQDAQNTGITGQQLDPRATSSNECWASDISFQRNISQPAKYLAFEGNAKPERMPVYTCGRDPSFARKCSNVMKPVVYRVASFSGPSEAPKLVLLPTKCAAGERAKCQPAIPMVCVNPRNLVKCSDVGFDRCSCSTKIMPCEAECQPIVKLVEKSRKMGHIRICK